MTHIRLLVIFSSHWISFLISELFHVLDDGISLGNTTVIANKNLMPLLEHLPLVVSVVFESDLSYPNNESRTRPSHFDNFETIPCSHFHHHILPWPFVCSQPFGYLLVASSLTIGTPPPKNQTKERRKAQQLNFLNAPSKQRTTTP